LLVALVALFAVLFNPSFSREQVLFANDGPLGAMMAYSGDTAGNLAGHWHDLNWLGGQMPGSALNLTTLVVALAGPVGFLKVYAPLSQLLLGVCAWLFFRQLRFSPLVCVLGGVAAALNMDAFSRACWGLGTWTIAAAMGFLTLAVLVSPAIRRPWLRAALAGLAVGLGVSEAFDTGALYSLFAAAFAAALPWLGEKAENPAVRIRSAVVSVAVMALFAGVIAAQTVGVLISTQIKGVAGVERPAPKKSGDDKQDPKAALEAAAAKRAEEQGRYDFATQWSLPKAESLRVIIPGLFGYRILDQHTRTNELGTLYWGTVGRQPGFEQHGQGYPRHSGSGEYAGVLVVLLAIWALLQAWRADKGCFTAGERKFIWFWFGVAVVSLFLAWGRHAPFYKLFYSLPYASTIRNPIKFMHQFHLALLVLFGFGLQGIWRQHVEKAAAARDSIIEHVREWWGRVAGFDRVWTLGCGAAVVVSVLAWMFFVSSRTELLAWLRANGYDEKAVPGVPDIAAQIAKFSANEIAWFLFFLVLSVGFVTVLISGALAGARSKLAAAMLGLLLVTDLGRADAPWIRYYNYLEYYATNPVIDILRERPWEGRVTALQTDFYRFYHQEWLQHHFPYYRIQSLDVSQEPRVPQEKLDYRAAFGQNAVRYWQLTNTRFMLAPSIVETPQGVVDFVKIINDQADPVQRRFKLHTSFKLSRGSRPNAPIITSLATNGPYALIEFTAALPRAALYTKVISTNRAAHLPLLANPAFDPRDTVLVEEPPVPALLAAPASGTNRGEVAFRSYAPKRIVLEARAAERSVLLLNDRHDPGWKVTVDGQPATLLRCNYIMRGVRLEPGTHTVEFRFEPPRGGLLLSLGGLVVALGLIGLVVFDLRAKPAAAAPTPTPSPAPPAPGAGTSKQGK
jgi:hypothetical protein